MMTTHNEIMQRKLANEALECLSKIETLLMAVSAKLEADKQKRAA